MSAEPIAFSSHALEQMHERGATTQEVLFAIDEGESFPAKKNRTGHRFNFPFTDLWGGRVVGIEVLDASQNLGIVRSAPRVALENIASN